MINLQDKAVIQRAIETMSFQSVINKVYELGYMRCADDVQKGKEPKGFVVTYKDMGTPDKPFYFSKKDDADTFKSDLEKRFFHDVEVRPEL